MNSDEYKLKELVKLNNQITEKINLLTNQALQQILEKNIDAFVSSISSRDKAIKLMNDIVDKILSIPENLLEEDTKREIKNWNTKFSLWCNAFNEQNEKLQKETESLQKEFKQEISISFKTNKKFKKYNLNNLTP